MNAPPRTALAADPATGRLVVRDPVTRGVLEWEEQDDQSWLALAAAGGAWECRAWQDGARVWRWQVWHWGRLIRGGRAPGFAAARVLATAARWIEPGQQDRRRVARRIVSGWSVKRREAAARKAAAEYVARQEAAIAARKEG